MDIGLNMPHRVRNALVALACGVALLGGAAFAAIPDSEGAIRACYASTGGLGFGIPHSKGDTRIVVKERLAVPMRLRSPGTKRASLAPPAPRVPPVLRARRVTPGLRVLSVRRSSRPPVPRRTSTQARARAPRRPAPRGPSCSEAGAR